MASVALQQKLEQLEQALHRAAELYAQMKTKNKQLETENTALQRLVEQKNEELKNYQKSNKISKIAASITDESPKSAELKVLLNEYIREIDRCIAFLNE